MNNHLTVHTPHRRTTQHERDFISRLTGSPYVMTEDEEADVFIEKTIAHFWADTFKGRAQ